VTPRGPLIIAGSIIVASAAAFFAVTFGERVAGIYCGEIVSLEPVYARRSIHHNRLVVALDAGGSVTLEVDQAGLGVGDALELAELRSRLGLIKGHVPVSDLAPADVDQAPRHCGDGA